MSGRRSTGNMLILAATLLFCSRYITIALLCVNDSASVMRINGMLRSIGSPLLRISIICYILGIVYLALAEWSLHKETLKKSEKISLS